MTWLKTYGRRYKADVVDFVDACVPSLLTALPLVVFAYREFALFAYVPVIVMSAMFIVVIGLVTALIDSYRWRFAIYCIVLAAFSYPAVDDIFAPPTANMGTRFGSLLVIQVIFGMGAFYYVLHRKRIAERGAARRTAAMERLESGSS